MYNKIIVTLFVLSCLSLTGCGLRGELYLPDQTPTQTKIQP